MLERRLELYRQALREILELAEAHDAVSAEDTLLQVADKVEAALTL